jgi:hypothetical protein
VKTPNPLRASVGSTDRSAQGDRPTLRWSITQTQAAPTRSSYGSLYQTDGRNSPVSNAIGHYFRMVSQAVLLAADRFGA